MSAEIDFHNLYSLTGADRKAYCQIIGKYVELLPENINDLNSSINGMNKESALKIIHDLKGSLSVLNILPEEISYDELSGKIASEGITEKNIDLIKRFIRKLQNSIQSLRIELQTSCPV